MEKQDAPYFFLSYSHTDGDDYLNQFFNDLRVKLAKIVGAPDIDFTTGTDSDIAKKLERFGFRDVHGVKTGDDWVEKIAASLGDSAVLVCLYTPSFFARDEEDHLCFCAREFAAFLKRDHGIRYIRTGEGGHVQLQKPRNVLPIIWYSLEDLHNANLPPYVLGRVDCKIDLGPFYARAASRYQEDGLRRIVMRRRSQQYDKILEHFARRIRDLAKYPLPPLKERLEFATLRNIFWVLPQEDEIDIGVSPAEVPERAVAPLIGGPKVVQIIEVRHSDLGAKWSPYAGERSIQSLVNDIARPQPSWKTFDPRTQRFADKIKCELEDAKAISVCPILIVDPRCLDDEASRRALAGLLREPLRAGLVVPADMRDRDAMRLIEQHRALLQPAEDAPDWVVRISTRHATDFAIAVNSVADDIRAKIFKTDDVRQNFAAEPGFATRPRIANS